MGPRVVQEIGHDLSQSHLVAQHHHASIGLQVDRAAGIGDPRVVHRVGHERGQVDRGSVEGPALVQPCQQQQVVHQDAHPRPLVLDPAHGTIQILRPVGGAPPEQLRVSADRGDRGSELVRSIADEPAQPLFGRPLLIEGRLDLAEHRVQREAQASDFRGSVLRFDAPRQVARGDGAGGRCHPIQRPEAQADQPPADRSDRHHHGRGDTELDEHQSVEGVGHLGQRDGDHDRSVNAGLSHRRSERDGAVRGPGRHGREVSGGLPMCRLLRARQPRRQEGRRRRTRIGAERRPGDELVAGRIQERAVRARRDEPRRTSLVGPAVSDLLLQHVGCRELRRHELLIDPVQQEGAEEGVRGHSRHGQARDHQGQCGREDPGPERELHSGGSRRTYPTPRTVWIRRGPVESIFLRR